MERSDANWEAGLSILQRYNIIIYQYWRHNVCNVVVDGLLPKNTFVHMIALGWKFHPNRNYIRWSFELEFY